MPDPTQIVWFKRDLRILDHAALSNASARGPVLSVYLVEREIINAPDYSSLHWNFVSEALVDLRESLRKIGLPLLILDSEAVSAFAKLRSAYDNIVIHCHEETGNAISYKRDRNVRAWAKENRVEFNEYPQNGVIRGLRNRDGWSRKWNERMNTPIIPIPKSAKASDLRISGVSLPNSLDLNLNRAFGYENELLGGEKAARQLLDSFLESRSKGYEKLMSSPNSAPHHCSRLSPYLAWGCISSKTVVQATRSRVAELKAGNSEAAAEGPRPRSLTSFLSRMHWRCHFTQKLEMEPEIEFRCFNQSLDNLRSDSPDPTRLNAWEAGETGFPFVDACMRYLKANGWINFRMRAMLVSFAAYDLWIDWRLIKDFLAQTFIDYEPGIHISQLQMQSGTTGINTLRIYNPIKQGLDHDPEATFIRRWVPEIASLSASEIHDWGTGNFLRPTADYPHPMVDHVEAVRLARQRFREARTATNYKSDSEKVRLLHGSRKRATSKHRKPTSRASEPASGS